MEGMVNQVESIPLFLMAVDVEHIGRIVDSTVIIIAICMYGARIALMIWARCDGFKMKDLILAVIFQVLVLVCAIVVLCGTRYWFEWSSSRRLIVFMVISHILTKIVKKFSRRVEDPEKVKAVWWRLY